MHHGPLNPSLPQTPLQGIAPSAIHRNVGHARQFSISPIHSSRVLAGLKIFGCVTMPINSCTTAIIPEVCPDSSSPTCPRSSWRGHHPFRQWCDLTGNRPPAFQPSPPTPPAQSSREVRLRLVHPPAAFPADLWSSSYSTISTQPASKSNNTCWQARTQWLARIPDRISGIS